MIELRSEALAVHIDPDYGCDVLSLQALPHGQELLWSSPWRARADALVAGGPSAASDSLTATLERYRGGWQTLCPNAGAPRAVHGGTVGFHGEVARSAWVVDDRTTTTADLSLDLISVPVTLERRFSLAGPRLTVTDRLRNTSDQDLEFDYCQHPAFGGDLLDGECLVTTGARQFVADPETDGLVPPGASSPWPMAMTTRGAQLDLSQVPAPGERQLVFGWLEDFDEHWYQITNPARRLSVRVEWDGTQLPYAWFWQELNHSVDYPWFRRARVLAIEPASTQTSGPLRRSELRLRPGAETTLTLSVLVSAEADPPDSDPTDEGA